MVGTGNVSLKALVIFLAGSGDEARLDCWILEGSGRCLPKMLCLVLRLPAAPGKLGTNQARCFLVSLLSESALLPCRAPHGHAAQNTTDGTV